MFLLGLTGSIGMGKSTTAQMFREAGCAVWDADAAVHRLYARGGDAVPAFQEHFPTTVENGEISRGALKRIIAKDPQALKKVEEIVHPLVGQDRSAFIESAETDILVLDIPLLFETGGDSRVDAVACVIVDEETQRDRVLARGNMTEADLEWIRSKQIPATEKAARADYVIETDTIEHARSQVHDIVLKIRKELADA